MKDRLIWWMSTVKEGLGLGLAHVPVRPYPEADHRIPYLLRPFLNKSAFHRDDSQDYSENYTEFEPTKPNEMTQPQ